MISGKHIQSDFSGIDNSGNNDNLIQYFPFVEPHPEK